MPSPLGLFSTDKTIFTADVLRAMIASAKDRILQGDFTNMSGAEKSHGKNWSMPPREVIFEANYALRLLVGPARITKVKQYVR